MTEAAKARKAPNILCAGGAVQDIVMRVDKFPDAGSKVQASEFLITSGGQAGNAAVAVARLGAKTSFAGALGDDDDEVANRIVESFAAREHRLPPRRARARRDFVGVADPDRRRRRKNDRHPPRPGLERQSCRPTRPRWWPMSTRSARQPLSQFRPSPICRRPRRAASRACSISTGRRRPTIRCCMAMHAM